MTKTHGLQCGVYRRVTCITCGHHDHAHDRATTECKWSGCHCKKFEPIEADAKYIVTKVPSRRPPPVP